MRKLLSFGKGTDAMADDSGFVHRFKLEKTFGGKPC
jgi:hypothetical protein